MTTLDCDVVLTELLLDGRLSADAAEHVRTCPRCAADAAWVRRVGDALRAHPTPSPSPVLVPQLLRAATPLLAANARRLPAAAWPRLVAAVAAALVPLPLILFVDWRLVQTAHELMSRVLPSSLSLYLVISQLVVVGLVLAFTYGAVPLLAAHQLRLQHEETHA